MRQPELAAHQSWPPDRSAFLPSVELGIHLPHTTLALCWGLQPEAQAPGCRCANKPPCGCVSCAP